MPIFFKIDCSKDVSDSTIIFLSFDSSKTLDKSISLAINDIKTHIKPISDIRGTADYRIESFRGLFRRLQKCLVDDVKTLSIMEYNDE